MMTLGEFIRNRRLELGLTQEELADRVGDGVRQADVSRLENNRVKLPRLTRLERFADALDAPVGTLLARSGWTGAEAENAFFSVNGHQTPPALDPSAAEQIPEALEKLDQVKVLVEEVEEIIEEASARPMATQLRASA